MSLRQMIDQLPKGGSLLASARLRRQIVKSLNIALNDSKMSQSELARALGKSRSAVSQVLTGDGNLKIETVAEYLHEMGAELNVSVHFPMASLEVSEDISLGVNRWVKTTRVGNLIQLAHSVEGQTRFSTLPLNLLETATYDTRLESEVA